MLGAITGGPVLTTTVSRWIAAVPQAGSAAPAAISSDPLEKFLEFFLSLAPQDGAVESPTDGDAEVTREAECTPRTDNTVTPQLMKWPITLPAARQEEEDATPRQSATVRIASTVTAGESIRIPESLPVVSVPVAPPTDRQTVETPREQLVAPGTSRQNALTLPTETRQAPIRETAPGTARVAFVATVAEAAKPAASAAALPVTSPEPATPAAKLTDRLVLPPDQPKLPQAEQTQPRPTGEAVRPPESKKTETRPPEQEECPAVPAKPETKAALPEHVPPPVVTTPSPQRPTQHLNQKVEEVRPQAPQRALPEAKSAPTGSGRQIVLQLPAGPTKSVEVHLAESAGRVRVTVRTNDPEVTAALRSQLTELVRSVTSKGMQIETWTPPDSYPLALLPHAGTTPELAEQSPQGDGKRQQQPQDPGPGDQRQKRGSQWDWFAELEDKLAKE